MDLRYTDADHRFEQDVRAFLSSNLPAHIARAQRQGFQVTMETQREWQRILYKQGWAAPHWPVEHGGMDWTPVQHHIFETEIAAADAPDINVAGLTLVGPVIAHFGSDALKAEILPKILSGDLYFGQGFSEPQAGSDLARLKTRAVRDGDEYVITGQKIWTSFAHEADMIFCLVRSDPDVKPQAGLSMILVPVDAPGLDIRPIRTIDNDEHVNEVFLDEVRVPVGNLIGEENKAWTYAKFLLDNERTYNAHVGRLKRYVQRVREIAEAEERRTGRTVMTEGRRRRLARIAMAVTTLEWGVLRIIAKRTDTATDAAAASSLKVRASELLLEVSELEMEVAGQQALAMFEPHTDGSALGLSQMTDYAAGLMAQCFYWRASSIFGGSNDIQRSVIWGNMLRTAN